jgi:hypothetical protein
LALNDRDYHGRLVQRGYDMDALKKLERDDWNTFKDMMVELEPPRVIWGGRNGWCEANIADVELVQGA